MCYMPGTVQGLALRQNTKLPLKIQGSREGTESHH